MHAHLVHDYLGVGAHPIHYPSSIGSAVFAAMLTLHSLYTLHCTTPGPLSRKNIYPLPWLGPTPRYGTSCRLTSQLHRRHSPSSESASNISVSPFIPWHCSATRRLHVLVSYAPVDLVITLLFRPRWKCSWWWWWWLMVDGWYGFTWRNSYTAACSADTAPTNKVNLSLICELFHLSLRPPLPLRS